MFRIHAVEASNRAAYAPALEEQFRLRHEIYVGERGWRDLARPDGREVDAFDTEAAVYLLGLDRAGSVLAGSRLVPSLCPHLMSAVFPGLAEGRVPRAADVWEWTRFFVVPALREAGRSSRAAGLVYCGLLEFCLWRGIRSLTIVCEPYWLDRLAALGWAPRRLGPVLDHSDGPIVGLMVEVTTAALDRTRSAYAITAPVLHRAGG